MDCMIIQDTLLSELLVCVDSTQWINTGRKWVHCFKMDIECGRSLQFLEELFILQLQKRPIARLTKYIPLIP